MINTVGMILLWIMVTSPLPIVVFGYFEKDQPMKISIGFLIMSVLLAGPVWLYSESNSATISINKDQWECTQTHSEIHTSYIMVNQAMISNITSTSECDEYRRKK